MRPLSEQVSHNWLWGRISPTTGTPVIQAEGTLTKESELWEPAAGLSWMLESAPTDPGSTPWSLPFPVMPQFPRSERVDHTGSLGLLTLTRLSPLAVIPEQTGFPVSFPASGFWFLLHLLQALLSA